MPTSDCPCRTPPFDYRQFDSTAVGIDETNGRYADVSLETCKRCGTHWLRYFVEYESFSGSGRWYRGIVPEPVARAVTPATAAAVLTGLDGWFRGGSFFSSSGEQGCGPLQLDAGSSAASTADNDCSGVILSVLREALASPRWNHPDLPGAAHLTELNERINNGERYAAFRNSGTGQFYLEIVESVESALNSEWLPFDVLGLTLPQAHLFLESVVTAVEQWGLANALPQLRAHHVALRAAQ